MKRLFGLAPTADFAELKKNGALIIDVRTKAEFVRGHIKGSSNVPLNELERHFGKLPKTQPIIACCASGMRSGVAKNQLKANGFEEVYNGGGWMSLEQKLRVGVK